MGASLWCAIHDLLHLKHTRTHDSSWDEATPLSGQLQQDHRGGWLICLTEIVWARRNGENDVSWSGRLSSGIV